MSRKQITYTLPAYRMYPTAERFIASSAKVKAARGPFGCLSCDTEVLTERGWIRIDKWNGERIMVAGFDKLNYTWFEEPERYIVEDCDEMWWFRSEHSISMMLSDEHRMPLYNWIGEPVVKSADRVARHPSRHSVPVSFYPSNQGTSELDLDDDQIRLAVAIHADGHIVKKSRTQITFGLRKDRKKNRLRELLRRNGIQWSERDCATRPTETVFTFSWNYRRKHFDNEWWTATRPQLLVVMDEFSWWDGLANSPERRYFSVHKLDADFIQYAAHATGTRASINEQSIAKLNHRPCYVVNVALNGSPKSVAQIRTDCTTITREKTSDGKKYCFTVSSGFFVARHRDCVFITGNCGKSSMCVQALWHGAFNQAPAEDGVRYTRMGIVRGTYGQLMSSSVNDWRMWVPENIVKDGVTIPFCPITRPMSGSPMAHLRVPWQDISGWGRPPDGTSVDCEVIFISCDDPRDISKLRGSQFTMIWFNEISEFPSKIVFDEATARLRFPNGRFGDCTYSALLMDTNPPDTSHWYYQLAEEDKPEGYEFFNQPPAVIEEIGDQSRKYAGTQTKYVVLHFGASDYTYTINPLCENIDAYGKRESYWLDLLSGKSRGWIKVFMMNQYGSVESDRPVYSRYDDERHCAKKDLEVDRGLPIIVSFDFGRTPSIEIAQMTPLGQLRVIDEITCGYKGATNESKMDARQFIRELVRPTLLNSYAGIPRFIVADPVGGQQRSQTDSMTCYQIIIDELKQEPEPILEYGFIARKDAVNNFLERNVDKGHPALLISPKCKILRTGFISGYCYPKMSTSAEEKARPNKDNIYTGPQDDLQQICLFVLNSDTRPFRTSAFSNEAPVQPQRPYSYMI